MTASSALSCSWCALFVSSSPQLILVGTVVRAAASVVYNSVSTQQTCEYIRCGSRSFGLQSIARDSPHRPSPEVVRRPMSGRPISTAQSPAMAADAMGRNWPPKGGYHAPRRRRSLHLACQGAAMPLRHTTNGAPGRNIMSHCTGGGTARRNSCSQTGKRTPGLGGLCPPFRARNRAIKECVCVCCCC